MDQKGLQMLREEEEWRRGKKDGLWVLQMAKISKFSSISLSFFFNPLKTSKLTHRKVIRLAKYYIKYTTTLVLENDSNICNNKYERVNLDLDLK